jgi:ketosteroid isomerase-like protein
MCGAGVNDEAEVWARVRAIYAGFLARDPDGVDALLHPDVTIWDSAQFPLTRGLGELADLRTRRPADPGAPTAVRLDARDPVIDVWGDTALVRHVLIVELSDGMQETVRNTSVWRRTAGAWLAVHNHEDIAGGGGRPNSG